MAVVEAAGAADLALSAASTPRNYDPAHASGSNSPKPRAVDGAVLRPHSESGAPWGAKPSPPSLKQPPPSPPQHQGSEREDAGGEGGSNGGGRDMRELEELLSNLNPMEKLSPVLKLNPMAQEFVPSNFVISNDKGNGSTDFVPYDRIGSNGSATAKGNGGRRKKGGFGQGKKRTNSRTSLAQRDEVIKRTVYVSDIDQQVTEEQLAALFTGCGQVVDCRICGDPHSVLRFAFIEFTDEEGARASLRLAGTVLGYYPVRVLPSKTAIAPVNPTFLPRSEDEREMCARTIYCTNIDKKVTQTDVKLFFESVCGEVCRLRLLGDFHHSTRIAFVEFALADSAIAALNCSGVVLGSSPIRVSPSKTPVRPRPPRPSTH